MTGGGGGGWSTGRTSGRRLDVQLVKRETCSIALTWQILMSRDGPWVIEESQREREREGKRSRGQPWPRGEMGEGKGRRRARGKRQGKSKSLREREEDLSSPFYSGLGYIAVAR